MHSLDWHSKNIQHVEPGFVFSTMIGLHEQLPSCSDIRSKDITNIKRTWRLLTDWNRTNLSCMGLPSFACSLVSSKIWAASGSTTSSTSSNPSEGRLIRSFTVFGALSVSFDFKMMDLTRTAWLNWDMNFRSSTTMLYDGECP